MRNYWLSVCVFTIFGFSQASTWVPIVGKAAWIVNLLDIPSFSQKQVVLYQSAVIGNYFYTNALINIEPNKSPDVYCSKMLNAGLLGSSYVVLFQTYKGSKLPEALEDSLRSADASKNATAVYFACGLTEPVDPKDKTISVYIPVGQKTLSPGAPSLFMTLPVNSIGQISPVFESK